MNLKKLEARAARHFNRAIAERKNVSRSGPGFTDGETLRGSAARGRKHTDAIVIAARECLRRSLRDLAGTDTRK